MNTSPTERSSLIPNDDNTHSNIHVQGNGDDTAEIMSWGDPWLFSVVLTILVLLPTLVIGIRLLVDLTDRLYPATPLAFHVFVALLGACLTTTTPKRKSPPKLLLVALLMFSAIDIILCGFVYSGITRALKNGLIDLDGTVVKSYKSIFVQLVLLQMGMSVVVWFRFLLGAATILHHLPPHPKMEYLSDMAQKTKILDCMEKIRSWTSSRILKGRPKLKASLQSLSLVLCLFSILPLSVCIRSCYRYFYQTPNLAQESASFACCDDLDTTDCFLPFPSFHHMRPDESSRTGWRVTLDSSVLPPMRYGSKRVELSFLNGMDGFSPMGGPILFYLDGLKETIEAQHNGWTPNVYPTLPYDFEDSIHTDRSITLLWDVQSHKLIPHTARMDYLDPQGPIVLLIPAQPLHHETHYAVAVVNATDVNGNLLPPTLGMHRLFWENTTTTSLPCSRDTDRWKRYNDVLLPSLARATNRTIIANRPPEESSFQLMFDFVTMSDESLQPIRIIRDTTLRQLNETIKHQVQVTKIQNQNCRWPWFLVARTIHGSLRVPWWLESDRRDATLSWKSLQQKQSNGWGQVKFTIHVPCSLYAAAVNHTSRNQSALNAILDYGHGLFYNRNEASEYAFLRIADDQGYLITAMDWRGMSSFDMPVLLKLLLADPNLIQATRDNIMQGYACRLAFHHYIKNGLLEEPFLQFQQQGETYSIPTSTTNDTRVSSPPPSIFYGNSQGGILGAAYNTLIGPAKLIQKVILGTPAISFTLVLYNSRSFRQYDKLLLLNFRNNRHVRIMLSVLQLAWDAISPSNVLAPPILEQERPPILLQSGLGDPVIPTIATEALVRALNASLVPHNPRRNVFGVHRVRSESTLNASVTVWTEVLYQDQYQSAPRNNKKPMVVPDKRKNLIHQCLRQDCALIAQMTEFIQNGTIVDPCQDDNCFRSEISCYIPGLIRSLTKFGDWWRCNYTITS